MEREESLEIDTESNLPMNEGETLDDFWLAEEIQEDLNVQQIKLRKEREESLEIDAESNPVHKFPVPMKEGEILDDFWMCEKIQAIPLTTSADAGVSDSYSPSPF
ncbi:hypothetical protein CCACVL1_26274 [Corchorus capsularis]|uniref:Uncharacterized protein n=1 Tax=Corchorus capsularis TaxID=210143 RepID=A0A1R3GFA2_COCAP|nr:hypothetical protein CCACVL1_26274 [Corchorus capsularis]